MKQTIWTCDMCGSKRDHHASIVLPGVVPWPYMYQCNPMRNDDFHMDMCWKCCRQVYEEWSKAKAKALEGAK